MIAMNARACILLHRAIHMQGASLNDADVQQNLAILHGLIIALRSELPNSILLQGCKSLRTVLLTRSLLNAATISVHVVDYSEPAAREICLTAAQDMFNLLGEQPKALKCLNPFMSTMWMTAWTILNHDPQSHPAAACTPQGLAAAQIAYSLPTILDNALNVFMAFESDSLLVRKYPAVHHGWNRESSANGYLGHHLMKLGRHRTPRGTVMWDG
ncbi:hypothetical protein C8R47DRAFT_1231197 [Mycena vitilis]|nr:hypothetical protein C8R47DRAFT_1231197 [Mycena vitilis]